MSEHLQWLQREWAMKLAPAVEAMTGESCRAEVAGGPAGALEAGSLIYRQDTNISDGATIWLEVPPLACGAIGQQVLAAAGIDSSEEADWRAAFIETLQQSLSPLAQSLGLRLKREVDFPSGGEAPESQIGIVWAGVRVTLGERELPPMRIAITAALESALAEAAALPQSDETRLAVAQTRPSSGSKTLELLMEVELPVGVSFGRAQMRLKDAIKLTTGSIVELNRSVTEPVEVIVNNCVIARGEVVVVEGNYGVRIQEIVSREERLRTLF